MIDLAYQRRQMFLSQGRFWTVFYQMKRRVFGRV